MRKIWLQAGLFLLCCSGAFLLFLNYSKTNKPNDTPVNPPPALVTIATALHVIERGEIINTADVKLTTVPLTEYNSEFKSVESAAGHIALRRIQNGERLSVFNTTTDPASLGLSSLLQMGLRAVAIRVSDEIAVANLIRAGDYVDVLVVSQIRRQDATQTDRFPDGEARMVLQNILVLAVGASVLGESPGEQAYQSVTLAVSPQQAATLALARTIGTYHLALRSNGDDTVVPGALATTQDITGSNGNASGVTAATKSTAATQQSIIEIINGSNHSHNKVMKNLSSVPSSDRGLGQ